MRKKRWITALICACILRLCTVFAWGGLPETVDDALSPDARELLGQLDGPTDSGTLAQGAARLWDKTCALLTADFRGSLRVMVVLLGAVLLYGVAEGGFQAAEHPQAVGFVPLAFVLVVTMTAAGDVQIMMGTGTETMEQLDLLSKALLPSLAAAVAASGGIVSAGTCQVTTVFFANLLMTLIRSVLLPLVYFYVAAASADAMLPGNPLKSIAVGIKKVVTWALTGSLVLFTGYLTISGAVLLYGVAEGGFQAAEHPQAVGFVPLAFVLVVTMTAAGDVQIMMGTGTETMEQLDLLSKALLPSLAAAVAASGGIVSAGTCQVTTVFFANLLMTLIRSVLLPLVYFYVAAASADAMLPGNPLKSIAVGIKKVVTWALTGSLVLFTGYLTISGAVSASADTLTLQMTRTVISTAVPVVGGIISQASGSVLSGAGLLKNTVGVLGMLAVLATCLTPFLHLAVQYLVYKLTAFLAGTAGSGVLVELIDALGGAFGLVLGMVGSCALLLLISITSSISVVIP